MTDSHLQQLKRAWEASGSVEDEAAYLRERVRVGELSELALKLGALVGCSGAEHALTPYNCTLTTLLAELELSKDEGEQVGRVAKAASELEPLLGNRVYSFALGKDVREGFDVPVSHRAAVGLSLWVLAQFWARGEPVWSSWALERRLAQLFRVVGLTEFPVYEGLARGLTGRELTPTLTNFCQDFHRTISLRKPSDLSASEFDGLLGFAREIPAFWLPTLWLSHKHNRFTPALLEEALSCTTGETRAELLTRFQDATA